jgi:signal transduction histidine kinase
MSGAGATPSFSYLRSMERLVEVVRQLSAVRDLDAVMAVVRSAARDLTGADGATFVLRDGDLCHYADEDAIAPLWKGKRFPMSACISGWAMLHREAVAIEDIYADDRIPADAYRPTFVKSLVMVPIRTRDPVGAIGNYWARPHRASPEEVRLLQALADSTSVAMESVRIYAELEERVRARTAELARVNRELESFAHTVSHDLRNPLTTVLGCGEMLAQSPRLDEEERVYADDIRTGCRSMAALIDGLMEFSRAGNAEVRREPVDLSALAREAGAECARTHGGPAVRFTVREGLRAAGDRVLLRSVLANLLGNAWKYSSKVPAPEVEFGAESAEGEPVYFVRDNGAGFDGAKAAEVFEPFRRLHESREFPGTGVGLATVRRVVERHGGRVWAESSPGKGATFRWTLPPAG